MQETRDDLDGNNPAPNTVEINRIRNKLNYFNSVVITVGNRHVNTGSKFRSRKIDQERSSERIATIFVPDNFNFSYSMHSTWGKP